MCVPGGIRTASLLICRPGRNPAISPWSFTYGGDPTGSVHLVSLASRPRCCHGCCQRSPRIQVRKPIRSADPHDVRGRSAVTVVRRLQTCLVSSKPERSWRLKIARAEHHLSDLRHLVESCQDGHHYRAVCPNPPRRPTHWRFVLEITEPPDPQIAVVLGDLLFNVRSALDHVAVACAPSDRKRQAGFPVRFVPSWARQARQLLLRH